MDHLIVGAGPAGVTAAETLRKLDPDGAITLIGNEPEPPYSRMAIPYFLIGNIDDQGTHLRPEKDHFQRLNITYRQDAATGLDAKGRKLALASGAALPYDRLLIAAGSRPIRPPIPGLDLPGVHHCWTLADARAIAKLAEKGSHVVLLGAGFIGCIIMESLAERGVDLTVVEMGDRMVPRMMDETAGAMIARWCETKGVRVRLATKIDKIEQGSAQGADTLSVHLSNGENLPAHLVVAAAGVQPNTEFLSGTGIEIDGGIIVDEHLQTSLPGVFAAGDICRGRDFSTGEGMVHAIQPTAADHGRIAAMNMCGADMTYQGSLQMNVLDTLGLISSSFGLWQGVAGGDTARAVDDSGYRYTALQFDGDVLIGAQTVGRTDMVGLLRGLIQTKVALGDWKERLMKDPNRIGDAYIACTQTIE